MLIQQPGMIRDIKLKNRIVMAPMGTNYSTTDGISTERDKLYYVERAKGGVAMIMTEAMVVTEQARPHHNSLCCYHDRFIPGLGQLVEAIKSHDCHVFGQLNHRGGLLRRSVLGMEPVGPSPWHNPNTGDEVRPLSIQEIDEIQGLFVAAARRLQIAGYDGVELHAANGYLFQQFFSPRINRRTDRYGGSLENRMRLLLETIDRLRNELPDFRLIVRLSASEFAPGGYSESDIIALAQAVEAAGADAIDLSGGSNESPQLSKHCIQPPSFERAYLRKVTQPIRAALNIPVIAAGRMVSPEDAELMLQSGGADFVALGRALYSDAHWCNKAFGKIQAPIRECIACNVCFERLTLEKDVACATNPLIGTEFETLEFAEPQLNRHDPVAPRRVLIIGAGLAGVEAARVIAAHGHHVEIWEKAERPGGQMHLAVASPDKTEVWPAWEYRWKSLQQMGVTVETGVSSTAERITEWNPDEIIVATGAAPAPNPLDISRLDSAIRVLHAWDVLAQLDNVEPGQRVTIVGGGMVGAELADALRVRACPTTVLEMRADIAIGMARNNRFELVERLQAAGVELITNCRVLDISGTQIHLQLNGGEEVWRPIGDALVLATGPRPNLDILDVVKATHVPYTCIGDCNKPGDFLSVLRDASMIGLRVAQYPASQCSTPSPTVHAHHAERHTANT
jgi:NADH:flavin oxidoreductases, Old Yellow Enzyme family